MSTRVAFCSACDRDVQILITDMPVQDAQAPVGDAEVVCLEIGERCTGHLCPIGAVSSTAMMVRLVRSGARSLVQPLVKAECEVCNRVTDFIIVSPAYATCADCGTTIGWDDLELALGRDG
jgi:hypothetical protein